MITKYYYSRAGHHYSWLVMTSWSSHQASWHWLYCKSPQKGHDGWWWFRPFPPQQETVLEFEAFHGANLHTQMHVQFINDLSVDSVELYSFLLNPGAHGVSGETDQRIALSMLILWRPGVRLLSWTHFYHYLYLPHFCVCWLQAPVFSPDILILLVDTWSRATSMMLDWICFHSFHLS